MGECYSCQAQSGQQTYPSDMSLASNANSRKDGAALHNRPVYAFKGPAKVPTSKLTRNSNEQSGTRSPLKSLDKGGSTTNGNHAKLVPSRFGFRPTSLNPGVRADSNSNVLALSSDSLDSVDLGRKGKGSNRSLPKPTPVAAFIPRGCDRWKMIDDSSTTNSDARSLSTQGKNSTPASPDDPTVDNIMDRNGNKSLPPSKLALDANKRYTGLPGPASVKWQPRLPTRPTGKSDKWVKAGSIDPESQRPAGGKAKSRFGFLGKNNKSNVRYSSTNNRKAPELGKLTKDNLNKLSSTDIDSDNVDSKCETPADTPADTPAETPVDTPDGPPQVSAKRELFAKDSSDEAAPTESHMEEVVAVIEAPPCQQEVPVQRRSQDEVLLCEAVRRAAIPLARMDSVETSSICSLNSDDLMLDLDLDDDDPSAMSSSTMDRSVFSKSGDTVERKGERHAPLGRVPSDGSTSIPRRQSGGRQRHLSSTSDAVCELTDLIQDGSAAAAASSTVPRRPNRLQRNARPASFPGPLTTQESTDLRRGAMLRVPRQPSIADNEEIYLDGNTFRHVMQDITMFKTMLYKLKGSIQSEDLGSPMNPAWNKNGFKLAGTPESPCLRDEGARLFNFGCLERIEDASPSQVSLLQAENQDLRQQLQQVQKQLTEQDRTIKLLQTQMTKYECGQFGPGGKEQSNAATQTDKPRMSLNKGVLRPSARGRNSEPAPVISSKVNEKVPEENHVGENNDVGSENRSRPKSLPLHKEPVKSRGTPKLSSGLPRPLTATRLAHSVPSIPSCRTEATSPVKRLPSPATVHRLHPSVTPNSPSPRRTFSSSSFGSNSSIPKTSQLPTHGRKIHSPSPTSSGNATNSQKPASPARTPLSPVPSSPRNRQPPSPSLSRLNVTKIDKSKTQLKSFRTYTKT